MSGCKLVAIVAFISCRRLLVATALQGVAYTSEIIAKMQQGGNMKLQTRNTKQKHIVRTRLL